MKDLISQLTPNPHEYMRESIKRNSKHRKCTDTLAKFETQAIPYNPKKNKPKNPNNSNKSQKKSNGFSYILISGN